MSTLALESGVPVARRTRVRRGGLTRLLLTAAIAVLPLQDHLPPIAGFSVMYLAFALLAIVAVVNQPRALVRVASSRVFVAAAVFLAIAFVCEAFHKGTDFEVCRRLAEMFAGAVIIGSYCYHDRRSVDAIFNGIVIAAVWVTVLIVGSSYSLLASAGVGNFVSASYLRLEALQRTGLHANLNELAFTNAAATCIELIRAILRRTSTRRIVAVGISLFCGLGTFMTLSRSGIAALALGAGYVLLHVMSRKLLLRSLLVLIAASALLFWIVPPVVLSRLAVSSAANGQHEQRVELYMAAADSVREFAAFGIGAGTFWTHWGVEHGFGTATEPMGPHNSFLAVAIYWGAPALLSLIGLMWIAWRAVAKRISLMTPEQRLAAKTYFVVMLIVALTIHDLYSKVFSILFGITAAFDMTRRRAAMVLRRHRQPARS